MAVAGQSGTVAAATTTSDGTSSTDGTQQNVQTGSGATVDSSAGTAHTQTSGS